MVRKKIRKEKIFLDQNDIILGKDCLQKIFKSIPPLSIKDRFMNTQLF